MNKNTKTIVIVIAAAVILAGGYLIYKIYVAPNEPENMFDCDNNTLCLKQNFLTCSPAKMEFSGVQAGKKVNVSVKVYGYENEKCRYKMILGAESLECRFPEEALTEKVFNQLFGENEGQDSIIFESCR